MRALFISLLTLSILLANFAYMVNHRYLGFYYILLLGVVGTYIWRNRVSIEEKLVAWDIGPFKKFLFLGIGMILLEETFAGFSLNLGVHNSLPAFIKVILQCWALNLFALPGFIIAWYLLLKRYVYTRMEVFVLVGLFGLYSEKIYKYIVTFPLMALFLLLPTMVTYAVIISPSVMSFRNFGTKVLPWYQRYLLGIIIPFLVSIPFIAILFVLMAHHPELFPLEFIH